MQFTPLTHGDFDGPGTVERGPFTVEIYRDDIPEHPADIDEGFPPCIHSYSNGEGVSRETVDPRFFSTVSARWCSRHWRAICGILDIDPAEHDMQAHDYSAGYTLPDTRQEIFADALQELVPGGYNDRRDAGDWLDTLAALYTMAGSPAYSLSRNGYCQGDTVQALFVYTPDFCARMGIDPKRQDLEKDADGCADDLAAYCFGDVYGYNIWRSEATDWRDCANTLAASCGGFYGPLWSDRSGIFEAINDDLARLWADHDLSALAMMPEAMQTLETMK